MNYIGSKYSLLPFLEKAILSYTGSTTGRTFFDIFAGTGVVGRHFKKLGFRIVANDIQYYSYCLNRVYVGINNAPEFAGIVGSLPRPGDLLLYDAIDIVLRYLDGLGGAQGFVYRNYCLGGSAGAEFPRQYFTDENGQLCDAIRLQIEQWYQDKLISENEYFYLLASLLEAIDKVANTASVYGAFLKHIKSSARKRLRLGRLELVPNGKQHQVHNCNGSSLVGQVRCDIMYMDPPYNQRQYCTNYHVLETIARYDNPELYGVTGLRQYEDQKSDFCYKKKVREAFKDLIQRAQARYVFLSYNSEGLMSKDQVIATMKQYGTVAVQEQGYRRFRADSDSENRSYKRDDVIEYLFCLEK